MSKQKMLKTQGFTTYTITKENHDLLKDKFFYNTSVRFGEIYDEEFEDITTHRALHRIDDNSIINIVSADYQITQHEDMILPFIKSLIVNDEYDVKLTIENIHNRNRAMCTMMSKETIDIDGEEYKKAILIANASDGSMSRKILAGLFRMVCFNMQFSGIPITHSNTIHRGKATEEDYHETFNQLAEFINQEVDNMILLIKRLHNLKISEDTNKFIQGLYKSGLVPKRLIENPLQYLQSRDIFIPSADIVRLENPKTLFDIYQKITLWSTHITSQNNITRGVNVNKKVFKVFNEYVKNIMD